MNNFTNLSSQIISSLSPLKYGDDLLRDLLIIPEYNESIRDEPETVRLLALSCLYDIYIPMRMSVEIYNKIYIALLNSINKKCSKEAVQQHYQNNRVICNLTKYEKIEKFEHNGIIGGADSFTIIGISGIGKSSAVNRAVSLITRNKIIELAVPYIRIIPCLVVQCPFDCSIKSLLLNILAQTDEVLESNYYSSSKYGKTTDVLIGIVGQVMLNHIGLLIVDEIQNVVNHRNGQPLINALTQLINSSGISICMVGTPDCVSFFESAMHLARRSVGLSFDVMGYDDGFKTFCEQIFQFQYTKRKAKLSQSLIEWLYQHSMGISSIVVSLIHDAQELAILSGKEIVDFEALNEAYNNRLAFIHRFIQPKQEFYVYDKNKVQKKKTPDNDSFYETQNVSQETILFDESNEINLVELVKIVRKEKLNPVTFLKQYITIEEIKI